MNKVTHLILTAALGACTTSAIAATAVFSGHEFELVGSASIVGTDLRLTPAQNYAAGAAWLTTAISANASFSASFSFSLADAGVDRMADGITFAIQATSPSEIGENGGHIGYLGLGAVGSIIQTWDNNRLGLDTSGNAYSAHSAPTNLGDATLVKGSQLITYDAAAHLLTMSGQLNVDGAEYDVTDSAQIDLGSFFSGSPLYLGFTGGTGGSVADQRITDFALLTPVPEPAEWVLMLAGLGIVTALARGRRPCERADLASTHYR